MEPDPTDCKKIDVSAGPQSGSISSGDFTSAKRDVTTEPIIECLEFTGIDTDQGQVGI